MDFTSQKICVTYPRLIQIDTSSNTIQDGLGNMISILPTTSSYAVTASYAVSASYEINYETSSSYADFAETASYFQTASITPSASYAETALSSSYALSASYAPSTPHTGLWTESLGGSIKRVSDVNTTGSFGVSGSLTVGLNNTTPHRLIGTVGVNTTAPSKQMEINSPDGNNFRLTYNDDNGNPANYTDFILNYQGRLSIIPSSGSMILSASVGIGGKSTDNHSVTGSLNVSGGITGSFTGSFYGDGSGLNDVVSSSYAVSASSAANAYWTESVDGSISRESDVKITGSLNVSGSGKFENDIQHNIKTISSNYTASVSDKMIFVSSSANLEMQLYSASLLPGKSLYIKLLDNILITFYPVGSDLIEFGTYLDMEYKGTSIELIPSGNQWFVI